MDSFSAKRLKPLGAVEETLAAEENFNEEEEEDIISNLPDSILCYILSKLPTKYAVGTAVLSTRWKHLFSQIPNLSLVINDSLLLNPDQGGADSFDWAVSHRKASFINFMYNLLTVTLRDVPRVRLFSLACHQDYGDYHIDAWFSAVSRLNVQTVGLIFGPESSGLSLNSLFRCTTLVQLILSQHCLLTVRDSVSLPNLKELVFHSLKFTDGESLEIIIDGCPVLEILSIDGCEFQDIEVLSISSQSLEILKVQNCCSGSEFELTLVAANLKLLYYSDLVAEGYNMIKLPSLFKAHLDIGPILEHAFVDDENAGQLFAACFNVVSLYLSGVSMTAIHSSYHPMPIYHNLIELKLGAMNHGGCELLPLLLERSPKLQVLVFMEGFSRHKGWYAKFHRRLPESVPLCLLVHLLEIRIEGFKGKKDELKLIEYFLKTAVVLRRVRICWAALYPKKQVCILKKLLMLPRCSKNCQIEFA